MIIKLSPIRADRQQPSVTVTGDTLIINGEAFDFSALEEGDILEADAIASDYITTPVTRTAGQLEVTLLLPHGYPAPEATRFPQPIIDPPDGPVELPLYNEPEPEPEPEPEEPTDA